MDENDIGTVIVDCAASHLPETDRSEIGVSVELRRSAYERRDHAYHQREPLMISPRLWCAVRKMIEQGGQPDACGAGTL